MPTYVYLAQNEQGKEVGGEIEAPSEMEAIAQVQRQGLLVLNVREIRGLGTRRLADGTSETTATPQAKSFSFFAGGGVPAADMVFLAEQLSTLLKGGLPLLQGLKLLGQNVSSPRLTKALDRVAQDIAGGTNLSQALARHPRIFKDIWVPMIEAGEASGQLPKALEDISNYLNQREALRAKVVTAFMYPSILLATSIFVLAFFIIKIVPVFSDIFKNFNLKLPPLTALVISVSGIITGNLGLIVGGTAGAFFLWRLYLKSDAGQWTSARLMLSLPMFGPFVKNILVEQFLVNFALLLKSGVDILKALLIMEKLLGRNRIISKAIATARESIKGGGTIAQGFAQSKAFPPITVQMMRIGEESGRLPEILDTLSSYYRRQIDNFIARLSSVIDPIMIVGVGMIVTVIVMAVFLPIFELSSVGTGGR
ncbi:MAG: type II secretion system F family protein [Elusimicrobia bacterium]|nr:type II secretion system F family protein [Elusimicrobiota bacterium]